MLDGLSRSLEKFIRFKTTVVKGFFLTKHFKFFFFKHFLFYVKTMQMFGLSKTVGSLKIKFYHNTQAINFS